MDHLETAVGLRASFPSSTLDYQPDQNGSTALGHRASAAESDRPKRWQEFPHPRATVSIPEDSQPLVSVIIPAYNAAAFLDRTLASILAQSYRNFEVIVVDDGSTDRTPDLVTDFAERDHRIHLVRQQNAGVAVARNTGIQKARGEFIAPIDADDIWYPDAIAKLVARFQQGPAHLAVVYAWSIDIDEYDRPMGSFHAATVAGNVYGTLICHNFLGNASSSLIRKSCLQQVGGYDAQLKSQQAQGCEDWDLYLRLAEHYEFDVVAEFLVGYRKLASSMSGDFSQMARSQELVLQDLQYRHPEIPSFLYRLARSSFYLYLAQQCSAASSPHKTLFWLRQAIQADPLTPLGRLGFYLLLCKSLAQCPLVPSTKAPLPESAGPLPRVQSQTSATVVPDAATAPVAADPQIHPLKVWAKVFVSNVLHYCLSYIRVEKVPSSRARA